MLSPLLRFVCCCCLLDLLGACPLVPTDGPGEGEGEGEGDVAVPCLPNTNTEFGAPATNRTDRIGSAATFEIGAWNIRNFPSNRGTAATVADVISSLDLDLVSIEEIADEGGFDELVARLPEHEAVLSTDTYSDGSYQKLGFVYRCGLLTPTNVSLIFTGDGFNFPRPPLQVKFHYDDGDNVFNFTAIAVHLKAQGDADSVARRHDAFLSLAAYVDSIVASGSEKIVILGDFNERLDQNPGTTNWAPFLDGSKYVVRTQALADNGESSFIGSDAILDHIVTTTAFNAEVGAGTTIIPLVDSDVPNYRNDVSDHRPVALILRGL